MLITRRSSPVFKEVQPACAVGPKGTEKLGTDVAEDGTVKVAAGVRLGTAVGVNGAAKLAAGVSLGAVLRK